ncbi:MAG TPA: DUF2235 domain-containing protein [Pseudolabrys sp.]|nr:DUF2235 domain-containing protein [Pseudolabrys sp.]
MANIVVCSDGTWNTPDDLDAGVAAPTNVVKIYNALSPTDKAGDEQKKYYHPGVGTDGGWWNKVAGGGAGDGLDQHIKGAYHWLARNYRPKDKIFLFGFSRGAFTVRSLGGMIARCGLLDLSADTLTPDKIWDAVDLAFDCYRKRAVTPTLAKMAFHNRTGKVPPGGTTDIHFIGVWDTVGALGIPDDMALLNLLDNPKRHSFHDAALSKSVKHGRHAVAMDERRATFTPTFWTNVDGRDVKQIWFPGVHSDVGGGYGRVGLSDGALAWMIDEATTTGLEFRPGAIAQIVPDVLGMLHDSVTSVFKALKTNPRCVPNVADPAFAGRFHSSAIDRFKNPPIQQANFWPSRILAKNESVTVDVFAREHWNYGGVFLDGGGKYKFTATGQWRDASIKCGPDGTDDNNFQIGEVVQLAASALGTVESLYRKATGNQQADFWWTKRVEDKPWFALIGVIANGEGADGSGNPIPHTTFLIGQGHEFKVPADQGGYLYCFANDAWQAYGNNSGSVSLTVKRTA